MSESLSLAFFSMPGGLEWVVIGLVALLLFGSRLPGVARSLGRALHEFRSGLSGQEDGTKKDDNQNAARPEEKKPGGET